MSSLRKRAGVWYLQWSERGEVLRRSTKIHVASDPLGKLAAQIQRDFDSSRAKQFAGIEDERVTIAKGFDRYLLTIRRTCQQWQDDSAAMAGRWVAWFTAHRATWWDEITAPMLDNYLHERGKSVSRKTQKTEMGLLCAAARMLNKSRTIKPLPVDTWPVISRVSTARPERVGAYSADDVEKILASLAAGRQSKHWVFPVMCLSYLGCRWSELARLCVRDVRLSPAPPMVRIESKKTGRTVQQQHRWVEIHPRILPEIMTRIGARSPDSPLIENLPSKRDANHVLTRHCARNGIQYRRLHGLRHYWISAMLTAGVPLAVVMTMAGHRNLSTTQGYLTISNSHAGWVGKVLPDGILSGDPKTDPKTL